MFVGLFCADRKATCFVPGSVINVRMVVADRADHIGSDWADSDNIWNKITFIIFLSVALFPAGAVRCL